MTKDFEPPRNKFTQKEKNALADLQQATEHVTSLTEKDWKTLISLFEKNPNGVVVNISPDEVTESSSE